MTRSITDAASARAWLQAGPRRRHAEPCHLHCALGGFGLGFESGDKLMGGLGGALNGFMAGLSTGNPAIAAVGGPIGKIGSIPLQKAKEASSKMTAINVIRQRSRISILTDGAGYDTEGYLVHNITKCVPIPHLRAALAARGSGLATSLFAANLGCQFRTFDEIVSKGGAFLEDLYDRQFAQLTAAGETEVNVTLAGFSESRGAAEVYVLSSFDNLGLDPWELHLFDDPVLVMPPPPEALASTIGMPSDAERIDPVTTGIKIMEAQRTLKFPATSGGDGDELHLIGGHILLTTIKVDEISQRIVHKWPEDVLGQRITPTSLSTPTPRSDSAPVFASRQQRRAWERDNRKRRLDA